MPDSSLFDVERYASITHAGGIIPFFRSYMYIEKDEIAYYTKQELLECLLSWEKALLEKKYDVNPKEQVMRLDLVRYLINVYKSSKLVWDEKNEIIRELETIPLIANYNVRCADRDNLKVECDGLVSQLMNLEQQNCFHPLWYFLNEIAENSTLGFECKCLRCGKEDKVLEYGFIPSLYEKELINDRLIYALGVGRKQVEVPFDVIQKEFLKLEKDGYNQEEIREMLFKKYSYTGKFQSVPKTNRILGKK